MDAPEADHDGVVDLSSAPLGEQEEQLATALRTALAPDRLDDERVQRLVDVAVLTAAHRRRQRLTRAPALALASAAAVVGVVVGVSGALPPSGGGVSAAVVPVPSETDAAAGMSGLSIAEVQEVIPGAHPTIRRGPFRPSTPTRPLSDACGTAPLTGAAVPDLVDPGWWDVDDADGRTSSVALRSTVATFASGDEAFAYAQALEASTSTCTPPTDGWAPAGTATLEDHDASALYTEGYHDGRWLITATVVRGRVAATLSAAVPVPRSGYEQAALDVIHLAALAADRAETA